MEPPRFRITDLKSGKTVDLSETDRNWLADAVDAAVTGYTRAHQSDDPPTGEFRVHVESFLNYSGDICERLGMVLDDEDAPMVTLGQNMPTPAGMS